MTLGENDLLEQIGFYKEYGPRPKRKCGLFGWGQLYADTLLECTVIEVKVIRRKEESHNECDIKNGLAQVIEYAVRYERRNAILIVIDAGRACIREWDDAEKKFIAMFTKHPDGINLRVVRVAMKDADGEHGCKNCEISVYPQ